MHWNKQVSAKDVTNLLQKMGWRWRKTEVEHGQYVLVSRGLSSTEADWLYVGVGEALWVRTGNGVEMFRRRLSWKTLAGFMKEFTVGVMT